MSLVRRLRETANAYAESASTNRGMVVTTPALEPLLREAADAIERLTAERDAYVDVKNDTLGKLWAAEARLAAAEKDDWRGKALAWNEKNRDLSARLAAAENAAVIKDQALDACRVRLAAAEKVVEAARKAAHEEGCDYWLQGGLDCTCDLAPAIVAYDAADLNSAKEGE